MGLFLVWRPKLICIVLSLCKHACKEVCDVKQGVEPYLLLARSCDRWWPDFVTFTACKRSIFGFKRGKKAQCISNRCKDLFKRKKYFGYMGTLIAFPQRLAQICWNFLIKQASLWPLLGKNIIPLCTLLWILHSSRGKFNKIISRCFLQSVQEL